MHILSLPLVTNDRYKYPAGWIMFTLASAMYLLSNHFHFFEPRQLPMTWIDWNTPFLPGTIWIYVSEYFYFPLIYILMRETENVNRYLYSFFGLQTVSVLIFLLWPTVYPRELFPLPSEGLDPLTAAVFTAIRAMDSPANCCPSLHVSSVYLSAFMFLREQREKFLLFFAWGTMIALSTLPTKQHYLVDILAGLCMGFAAYWFFNKKTRYLPMRNWLNLFSQAKKSD